MATYTPNLNLYKPDPTDDFGNFRAEFNNNMDILDNGGGGGGNDIVHLTQAQYDALPSSKLTDNKLYMIEDGLPPNGGTSYVLNCPTSGYTSQSVSVWGETRTLYVITLTADSASNPLTNFHSGMKEDYPLNISGSASDFSKLYAYEIGEGEVTFYFTSAPSSAFNVLIREAV